ncbi:DUF1642 domain-containing protein [Lactococcus lactis]|uniref:DUF1642 domain-containing protein n=1 Tax=Lactococcus lactis TaxID=1358 RepID=UPI001C1F4C39|nr:DUF1642 domain-containing protein [Lactococcus lactis]MBU7542923.1 DUF1642 domain-containing protein [Lactococcus lactis]
MTKFEEELSNLPVSIITNYGDYWNKAQLLTVFKDWQPQQSLPVVPSFVAEWYEKYKDNLDYYIYIFCKEFYEKTDCSGKELTKFENWFDIDSNQPIETLVRMKDGYTVEKPQLFYIELPNVYGLKNKVSVSKVENGTIVEFSNGKNYALKLTEQEIKSIDERYWQFAVPVEEVE